MLFIEKAMSLRAVVVRWWVMMDRVTGSRGGGKGETSPEAAYLFCTSLLAYL